MQPTIWGINLRGQTKRYKITLKKELSSLEEKEEEGTLPANLLDKNIHTDRTDENLGRRRIVLA
jgi:hypothetical protein